MNHWVIIMKDTPFPPGCISWNMIYILQHNCTFLLSPWNTQLSSISCEVLLYIYLLSSFWKSCSKLSLNLVNNEYSQTFFANLKQPLLLVWLADFLTLKKSHWIQNVEFIFNSCIRLSKIERKNFFASTIWQESFSVSKILFIYFWSYKRVNLTFTKDKNVVLKKRKHVKQFTFQ